MSTATGDERADADDQGAWDLGDLIDLRAAGLDVTVADDRAAVDALLDEADRISPSGSRPSYEGKVGELDGPGLLDAMQRLGRLSELVGRALNFAHLRFAADTEDPEIGALLQRSSERATQIQTRLLFFELEWVAIDDERAEELLATDGLDFCRHHLRVERRYRPHLLTAPEERIVTEMSVSGRGAWGRLFDELTSSIRVEPLDGGEPVSLDVALSGLFDPERERRRDVAEAVTAALEPGLRTRAYVFNTLLQDKATMDRLRSYPHWLATRNLSNEASDESVQALVEAVRKPQRAGAALVPDEGEAARRRSARRLRPDGRRRHRRRADRLGRGSRDRPRDLRLGLAADERDRRPIHGRALDRRPAAAVEARRRLQRLDRPLGPPLRDAQLDRPAPRRDHARPRARPRHPPVPRRASRASSTRARR